MARTISLSWRSSYYRVGRDDGVRLRVDATCATDMPDKIFAYRMRPLNPNGAQVGWLSHVCSPVDLEEYPETAPNAGEAPEWFRLSYIDVFLRSVAELEEFLEIVIAHVRRLKRTLDTLDTLQAPTVLTIGTGGCTPDIDDSSSSAATTPSSASLGTAEVVIAIATNVLADAPWIVDGTTPGQMNITLSPGTYSPYLLFNGFDFSDLPEHADIISVDLELEFETDFVSDEHTPDGVAPQLAVLRIIHPDAPAGDNLSDNIDISEISGQTLTKTDSTYITTLTPAQLQDGGLGVGILVRAATTTATTIQVRDVTLSINFREIYP